MFFVKPTKASTRGNSTQYYSNTNPTNNGVVVEADSPQLSPGEVQPPYAPDTITPPLSPTQPSTNLLLPVSGSFGKVFVLATKPAPNAAVVVVEATNDKMLYSKAIDTNYLGKPLKDLVGDEDAAPTEEPVWTPDEAYIMERIVDYATLALSETVYSFSGFNSPELTNAFKGRIVKNPKVNAFVKYAIAKELEVANSYYNNNKIEPSYVFAHIPIDATTVELFAFTGSESWLDDSSVSFGVFPLVNPVTEAYLNTFRTGGVSTVRLRLYVAVSFVGLSSTQTAAWLGFLCGFDVTIKFYYPGSCYPVADQTQPPDLDNITFDSLTGVLETTPDEPPPPEDEYDVVVRRGYTNIGGKLKYLYTVDTTQETTVHLNYDGSNYGCKLIITAPSETARTVNLTTAQQAALEQCLPQPDATLKGGFAATSNTGGALAFKSYGFESIFYRTRSPVAYNNTTIKACAIYGL